MANSRVIVTEPVRRSYILHVLSMPVVKILWSDVINLQDVGVLLCKPVNK